MEVFTTKNNILAERFYCWVYWLNVGVAIMPSQTFIRKRVNIFILAVCKYYLVVQFWWGEGCTSLSVIMFGWLVKIKSMQEDEDERMWVGSLIIWWSPWKEVIDSSLVPSILPTSPDHQLEDLALKSPVINSKWGLKLFRYTIECSKFLMKWLYSFLDWLGDR